MFFLALFLILIIIWFVRFIINLSYMLALTIDILVIGGFAAYYGHHEWFIHIASGKAVYFWDGVLFVLVGFLYVGIVGILTRFVPWLAYVFHYIVAWIGTGIIYIFVNLVFFNDIGKLLDDSTMNYIVHLVIVSLIAIILFVKRVSIFNRE